MIIPIGDRIQQILDARHLRQMPSFFFDEILLQTTPSDDWRLWESLYFYSARHQCVLEAETGFLSDLGSFPRPARMIFDRNGPGKLPCIMHDRGYDTAGVLNVYAVQCLHTLAQFLQDYQSFRTLVCVDELERVIKTLTLSRRDIDLLFLDQLAAQGVSRFEQLSCYHAVRIGGGSRFGQTVNR